MAVMVAILDFRSESFLAISDLQVTLILPTMFQVNRAFNLGEAKNRF